MLLFIIHLVISFALSSQRTIRGQIVDVNNKNSVYGASVFIDSSIEGATTDTTGCYRQKLPIEYFQDRTTPLTLVDIISENDNILNNIDQHFNRQLSIFPQEKIHLHTDRDFYLPGEKIWFKAYLTDASTHLSSSNSRYIYVELISPVDTLVGRVMIRLENDMYYGYIFLSEFIAEGTYTLRAYTQYMNNLGDDFFYKKNIRVESLNGGSRVVGATLTVAQSDFDVTFFPEGGNLVEGVFNTVGFKGINRNGYPATVTGKIVDENDVEITSVQTFHAGMGVFTYMPETGKRYYLKCRNENGFEKQFVLPLSNPLTCSLTIKQHKNRIAVGVQKSVLYPTTTCYLLAHCRGNVLYFSEWNKQKEYIVFEKERFPAGVIQFVLLDEQMNLLSERLVFCKNYSEIKVEFQTDKTVYEKREKVKTTLSLNDSNGTQLDGHLSVAITDDKDIAVDSSTTILSTLLLSSDLKGFIENPAWYLQDNPKSSTALDYLMMTHGWRRYNTTEVVKGNIQRPEIAFQKSQEISGQVKSLGGFKYDTGYNILIQLNNGEYGLVATDKKNEFLFQNFEYPDSTAYFLQAFSNRASDHIELVLNQESFPDLIHAPQTPFVEVDNYPSLRENAFIEKAEQRARYIENIQVIHLGEIEVTAPRIEQKNASRLDYWANKSSDVSIEIDEKKRNAGNSVSDLLRQYAGAGVNVLKNGYISIRGSLETAGYLPLIIIDGLPVYWQEDFIPPLDRISILDVESIDIFKGASSTVFGVRGAGGVISVTTRRGRENNSRERDNSNFTVYTPLGYQKPVEFYSPKYETLESKHLTIPDYRTTIFWKPDIVISDEEETTFEFYTSDFPTTYSVVIEGLTNDGRIVRQVEKISVK